MMEFNVLEQTENCIDWIRNGLNVLVMKTQKPLLV